MSKTMEKKIKIKPEKVDSKFTSDDLKKWLQTKAKELQSPEIYLLSFHDDGVVWGKFEENTLKTSDFKGSPSPQFRSETLQELRLFGENGQLHIWRTGETEYKASLALESYLKDFEPFEENQVLYGTDYVDDNGNFMIVRDGSEGLKHAFPIIDKSKFDGKKRPLRLKVNHYIEYDKDGCARVAYSRLVDVKVV
jgi:CRISPR-associated protein (TIGR03984 family)